MKCRHCDSVIKNTFLDLGFAPPSNAYLDSDRLSFRELYFPLKVNVCEGCWLVQTEDYNDADELFTGTMLTSQALQRALLSMQKSTLRKLQKDSIYPLKVLLWN